MCLLYFPRLLWARTLAYYILVYMVISKFFQRSQRHTHVSQAKQDAKLVKKTTNNAFARTLAD
jgi:hypothetical protein